MSGESKFDMQCAEFEALLADALDNVLGEADEKRFQAHLAACPSCAPLYNEAQAGLSWLSALKGAEVDPPAEMVENILRATIGTSPIPNAVKPTKSWWERLNEVPALAPIFQTVLQPRFAMGFGMAFFSITMLLNLAGVKVRNISHIDLRPSAIVTAYGEMTGKVVKYWDNIRFVYEVESKVRDLKKAVPSETKEPAKAPAEQPKKDTNRQTSSLPDQDSNSVGSTGRRDLANTAAKKDGASRTNGAGQRRMS